MTKEQRLLKGKDAALNSEDMNVLLDAYYENDGPYDPVETGKRIGFRDGYHLGLIAGAEQLLQRIGHLKVVDDGRTVRQYTDGGQHNG